MKIAISGPAGVGKTFVAKQAAEELTRLTGHKFHAIEGIGKQVMTERWGTPFVYRSLDSHKMLELNSEIISRKIEIENSSLHFVADRSVLDYLAILIVHCYQVLDWEWFEHLQKCAADHTSRYDKIFMLQHGSIEKHDDSIRIMNSCYQYMIELTERGLYAKHKINYTNVYESNLTKRIDAIASECFL